MGVKKYKLKKSAKALIFILITLIVLPSVYFAADKFLKNDESSSVVTPATPTTIPSNEPTSSEEPTSSSNVGNEINLSVSEKISWKPILDANGGLTTQPGSIYDKLGIKVNIKLDNNPDNSSQEFIDNKSNALGYTVNGYSALYRKFQDANVETIMPYIVDSSTGTDGIIVRGNINSVNDFVGKKIGVPYVSSDQAMVIWLMLKSDLPEEQFTQILKENTTVYKSVKETAQAFFNGEVDIAGVRQPYLTQAKNTEGTKVLFTTKSAKNLIANGIVFRKDFVDSNPEVVTSFIDGAFQALEENKGFENVRLQPSFEKSTDEELNAMLTEMKFNNFTDNSNMLGGISQQLFEDMNKVWELAGQEVVYGASTKALTKEYIDKLNGKYTLENATSVKVDDATKQKAQQQDNDEALLKKSTSINFKPNSAKFLDEEEAQKALNEFVNIASILDGAVIQIEGNIADTGVGDTEAGRKLSLARAKTIAEHLAAKGVDESRFIVIGNGIANQIADNKTTEGQLQNRRTDIFFKVIE
ncbi:putative lipoprotein YiaD precursor [compost metagenome]